MICFGQNLYLWRAFKGLSQKELAKGSGVPRPNLSAIEKGKREVSLSTLRALAATLGTDPGVLVDGIGPVSFKDLDLSRGSLERIAEICLGISRKPRRDNREAAIGAMLAAVIRNRTNALDGIYKKTLGERHTDTVNWLMLKSALGERVLNSLLSRLAKHAGLKRRKKYG